MINNYNSKNTKIILISPLPKNSVISLNLNSWQQIEENVPWCFHVNEHQIHLLTYSVACKSGEQSPKTSTFIYFDPHDKQISFAYNRTEEELQRFDLNDSENQTVNKSLKNSLDLSSAGCESWQKLFGEVKKKHIQRFAPNGNKIHSVDITSDDVIESDAKYPTVPDVKIYAISKNISNSERTYAALDSSPLLQDYLFKNCDKDFSMLLGELQFSFVTFVLGEHFLSFQHWLDLSCLVLRAESVFELSDGLLSKFVVMLDEQLKSLPQDIFAECLPADNKLLAAMQAFSENWPHEKHTEQKLAFDKILNSHAKKFYWDLKIVTQDEMPQIA